MSFQFTFSLPSIPSPFLSTPTDTLTTHDPPPSVPDPEETAEANAKREIELPASKGRDTMRSTSYPRLSASPAPDNISVKRGWEPSYTSATATQAVAALTTPATAGGYLDTPAKYREMAMSRKSSSDCDEMIDAIADDLRPAKRRKTVTESIVSTAYSAALIGTAVGFTVYRLWRDRGKEQKQETDEVIPMMESPPPPYEVDWNRTRTDVPTPPSCRNLTPHSAHRVRTAAAVARTRRRPRKKHHRASEHASAPSISFIPGSDDQDMDDGIGSQMDVMSQRLAKLIEEGQRALGREVVVMSEAKEDEVDDGSGQWVEDEPDLSMSTSLSTSLPNTPSLFSTTSMATPTSSKHRRGHSSPEKPRLQ